MIVEVVVRQDGADRSGSSEKSWHKQSRTSAKQHTPRKMSSPVFLCSAVDGLFLPLSEKVLLSLNLLDSAITSFLDPNV